MEVNLEKLKQETIELHYSKIFKFKFEQYASLSSERNYLKKIKNTRNARFKRNATFDENQEMNNWKLLENSSKIQL